MLCSHVMFLYSSQVPNFVCACWGPRVLRSRVCGFCPRVCGVRSCGVVPISGVVVYLCCVALCCVGLSSRVVLCCGGPVLCGVGVLCCAALSCAVLC